MISKMIFIFFCLFLSGMEVESKSVPRKSGGKLRSCLDHLRRGNKSNGYYTIDTYDPNDEVITVYCDMTSEVGSAWTLVMSFAFKNPLMEQFSKKGDMQGNKPVNEHTPNWNLYRMSLEQMKHLKSQSTHWRVTCSFPTHKVDYTDYVRAKFADFDVMIYPGAGECKKVEYINIRGHQCAQCTSKWWQTGGYAAHIDSDQSAGCQFVSTQGSVDSEDNFGYYQNYNNKFRCTADLLSTTNWWFGGYL